MALFRKSSFCDFRSRREVEESLLDCGLEKIFISVALSCRG